MDEDIVHQKIGKTIDGNAHTDIETHIESAGHSEKHQDHTWNGKNQKEGIILFEETGFRLMVVFMEIPAKTVHHIFMRKPGYEFHKQEGGSNGNDIDEHG
jgi:hypothetical protein